MGVLAALWAIPLFAIATVCSLWHLVRFRADVCVCLGGYGSLAPGIAARILRVPLVLLEPNAVSSSSSRLLSKAASCRMTYLGTPFAGAPSHPLGYPVRDDFTSPARGSREQGSITITGGSQGAKSLNDLVITALQEHPELHAFSWTIIAGPRWSEEVSAAIDNLPIDKVEVLGFVDDMATRLAKAQLVVSRAGASTIAELATLGSSALLVPLDTAAGDHQWGNARVLEEKAAALVLPKDQNTTARSAAFAATVTQVMQEGQQLAELGKNIGQFSCTTACEDILAKILEVSK